jgi:hypothetical protein
MFVSNKRNLVLPKSILYDCHEIQVVESFRLLGVIIDRKLNFLEHVGHLRKLINIRLYSIKRLFFLSFNVKIQFFKTFILPYFNFCATTYIYFNKASIQKLANSYNNCLFKLINSKIIANFRIDTSDDYNKWNNALEHYGLNCFQHLIILRLSSFIHKLFNNSYSPSNLFNQFIFNRELNKNYPLKNLHELYIPSLGSFNSHMKNTFAYFFSKFINKFYLDDLTLKHSSFNLVVYNNINLIFLEFVILFDKFDLNFKKCYIKEKKNIT